CGGAREARWRAKESDGAADSGREGCHPTCCASGINLTGAAANAGTCSAWQMWQAVSGPLGGGCRSVPPAAKDSNATQPSMAKARRRLLCLRLSPHISIHLQRNTRTSVYQLRWTIKPFGCINMHGRTVREQASMRQKIQGRRLSIAGRAVQVWREATPDSVSISS